MHQTRSVSILLTIAAVLLGTVPSSADPVHAIAQGAFQHHDSGWIFPQQVAGFARVGVPQDVDGSRDAIAYYARADQGVRSTAVVDVHPKDSAAGALTVARAQAALEREAPLAAAKKVRTQLEVGTPALVVAKVAYRAGTLVTCLYFMERGEWIVSIRASSATLTSRALDDFVRAQRWESLGNAVND